MSITIVIEVSPNTERSPFEDTKACIKALLQQFEQATPEHPIPRTNKLHCGVKLGYYAVYFPIKSRSVMELIKITHDGTDLTPIDLTS